MNYRNAFRFIKIIARNHRVLFEHDGIRYQCPSCGEAIGNDTEYMTTEWNQCRAYFHMRCLQWTQTNCFICKELIKNYGVKHAWGLAHADCLIKEVVRMFSLRDNIKKTFRLYSNTISDYEDEADDRKKYHLHLEE